MIHMIVDAVLVLTIVVVIMFMSHRHGEEKRRLREEARKVEELNQAQGRFFSSMSHEIRTPINTILGLNELILRDETVSDDVVADANNIAGAGKMLLTIINDILDMSKLESGRMDIVPVTYSVRDLVVDLVNMIRVRANEKGLKFDVEIDPKIPRELYGDEVRIKQILINMLNNAVKYTQKGSVILRIEGEEMEDNRVGLIMSVTDTGQGIKKEVLPYLFDAFKRVNMEENRNIEGTGLGLFIVKELTELMGGDVSVDSVYKQGSTFTVNIMQDVVNSEAVGRISLNGEDEGVQRLRYQQSFEATDARILIVDDNELNIAVESALLEPTKVEVDTALSGAEALALTLERHYDVIFMDHVMPEMDGIETFKRIKKQTGGLNLKTPIVVLTANAGTKEQESYRNIGFDEYLTKPVSGRQLENTLVRFLPEEKVRLNADNEQVKERFAMAASEQRRIPVAITTSSISDMPFRIVEETGIGVIPFVIHTVGGTFEDNIETDSDEVIRYMDQRKKAAKSEPPSVEAFESFFADQLRRANHVIHISLAKGAGREYARALQAAQAFSNVTVIDSGVLSSSVGILALSAYRMVQNNDSVDKIVIQLEELKKRMNCSFVANTTEYMCAMGNVSERMDRVSRTLMLHPILRMRNSKLELAKICMGHKEDAWRKYIAYTLPSTLHADNDFVFVTYVGVEEKDLRQIEKEIRRRGHFEHIIFKKASTTISLNVGPGAFGLLFLRRGKDSYHIGRLLDKGEKDKLDILAMEEYGEGLLPDRLTEIMEKSAAKEAEAGPRRSVPGEIRGIDMAAGTRNCGSHDGYMNALDMFYEAVAGKKAELEGYFAEEDWEQYTIKVHALKSSANVIGAMALGELALTLEDAGKAGDIDFIRENHERLMSDYAAIGENLRSALQAPEKPEEEADKAEKAVPEADEALLESAYELIRVAANNLDPDGVEAAVGEIEEYALQPKDKELFDGIKEKLQNLDFEGINQLLDEKGK